jgi:pyruvate-ferredoxin/flavodoxin oxidoreductase
MVPIDGNTAAGMIGHATSEVIAIYPITPSSPMGELSDELSSKGEKNVWGTVPHIAELQSEGGASGAVHGALQAGALSTTFTASQGLLLMIPNMFKIAGELTSTCFHVTARTIATHALSIFGDHSDVMACRGTGWGMLASSNVQEAHDMALIGTVATLKARIPFVHFFDGFRTSHEISKIAVIEKDQIRKLVSDDLVRAHRLRGMSPDRPVLRGTAQNPDVFMQAREAVNKYYAACPKLVEETMAEFAKVVGREYKLFDYVGDPNADRVIIIMGSGADTAWETTELLSKKGEKVGLIKVHLYRPFSIEHFVKAIPASCHKIAVLDRTKEPGSIGEPMYEDVRTAFGEAMQKDKTLFGGKWPVVVGGRYGLSSKEFTPAMVKAVFDNLNQAEPKNHFTVGINDDVTQTSLAYDHGFDMEPDDVRRCMFFGLGSDGTVGANKNSIKIIADHTDFYAQGYFVYDSKKAGAITTSHLRFGPRPIRSAYLITSANFIACHQWSFLEKYDMLKYAKKGATFLVNSIYGPDEVWNQLPKQVQKQIIDKDIKFYVIDGYAVGEKTGMGVRINTIMQTCFFNLANVIPAADAISYIKKAIDKTYSKKGGDIVKMNYAAVDEALAHLHEVKYPKTVSSKIDMPATVAGDAPEFVKTFTAEIMAGRGDDLPVSKFSVDGTFPTATTQWEKRNVAMEIPVWEPDLCIQCGKCSIVCPHAAIRMKIYPADKANGAPSTFKSSDAKTKQYEGMKATIQIFPEDCTGCMTCVNACPAKDKENPARKAINMAPQPPLRETERENAKFFLDLPELPIDQINLNSVKGSQLRRPLFEFSGACAGCGETPYLKLVTQMFGDRMICANATGCSSIYGGNLPTTPYCQNLDGRGPTWSNSLFEDNAEFGYGMRLTVDKLTEYARELVSGMDCGCLKTKGDLVKAILEADQSDQAGIDAQRARIVELKKLIAKCDDDCCKELRTVADYLVKKSVWIIGGDGWAYDIGYGGLDHVLASGRNVNILVMDTEVYSNTGGQASKATPIGAVAKFAEGGKPLGKKDLAMMAMSYGNVYVGKIALGANDAHAVKTILEAESYNGPSLILAYAHCIAHGIPMGPGSGKGMDEQKKAVECGHWQLMRFDPRKLTEGVNPLTLDSKPPVSTYQDWALGETRFKVLHSRDPEAANALLAQGDKMAKMRYHFYEQLAGLKM